MTATHFTFKRPLASFEIQQYLGRMPTKEERQEFSAWRSRHEKICLECNTHMDEVPLTECKTHRADLEAENRAAEARRLASSTHAFNELLMVCNAPLATKIHALIEAMIREAAEEE